MLTDFQQFAHPELYSEFQLLEILKSRCIEVPNINSLKKSDLLEMFRRIVLPLPQRRHNEAKILGKKLHDLRLSRNISIAIEEDEVLYTTLTSGQNNSKSFEDVNSPCKRVRLSNPSTATNGLSGNCSKRKINDNQDSTHTENKKRQKITWP